MAVLVSKNSTSNNKILTDDLDIQNLNCVKLGDGRALSVGNLLYLPSCHKEKISSVFSEVMKREEVQTEMKAINAKRIHLETQGGKIAYRFDKNRQFKVLDHSTELASKFVENTEKLQIYAQNIGILKARKLTDDEKSLLKTSPLTIERIRVKAFKEQQVPDQEWTIWTFWLFDLWKGIKKICMMMGIDYKKIWPMKSDVTPNDMFDSVGTLFSGFQVLQGKKIADRAAKINDKESHMDGKIKAYRGVAALFASFLELTVDGLQKVSCVLAKAIMNSIVSVISVGVSFAASLRYAYFWNKATRFQKKLESYINNTNLSEETKIAGTLRFLQSRIQLSENEGLKIFEKVKKQNANLSDAEIKKIADNKIQNRVLTKINRFSKRVDSDAIALIQKDVDNLLANINDPKVLEKAKVLIDKVKKLNEVTIRSKSLFASATFFQGLEILILLLISLGIGVSIFHLAIAIPFLNVSLSVPFMMGLISSILFIYLSTSDRISKYLIHKGTEKKPKVDDFLLKAEA